jgi:hypothetical protein
LHLQFIFAEKMSEQQKIHVIFACQDCQAGECGVMMVTVVV